MATVDLKKVYRTHYRAADSPELVDVPERSYLAIDGARDPNGSAEYRAAVAALYSLAYALRAAMREATGTAYTVMPLEGLWWADDMARFSVDRRHDWRWTLMICQPDAVTDELFAAVAPRVVADKALEAGDRVRLERYHEGRAAQVMHHGPYSDEVPTIEALHGFITDQGMRLRGKHHEIYLSDPRRVAPEKMRTIIRQPVD